MSQLKVTILVWKKFVKVIADKQANNQQIIQMSSKFTPKQKNNKKIVKCQ